MGVVRRAWWSIGVVGVAALAAIAGRCDGSDADFPLSYETPTCADPDVVPTAIPTEEGTPEWLSNWSDMANRAARRWTLRSARDLASRNVSMADVARVEGLADVMWPQLDETLAESNAIITGGVTGQKLTVTDGEREAEYLLSRVESGSDTYIVAQWIRLHCEEGGVRLVYLSILPPLELGKTYALLLANDGLVAGVPLVLPQIFLIESGNLNNISTDDQIASVEELRERHEAAR